MTIAIEQPVQTRPTIQAGGGSPVDEFAADAFARMAPLSVDDPHRLTLRDELICAYLPFARRLARRFSGRGESLDDLTQVATVGLIKSVDRFDITRGIPFANFAGPTVVGELKRHFRDTTWKVRVPHPMQELALQLTTVNEDLGHALHRSPTTPTATPPRTAEGRQARRSG